MNRIREIRESPPKLKCQTIRVSFGMVKFTGVVGPCLSTNIEDHVLDIDEMCEIVAPGRGGHGVILHRAPGAFVVANGEARQGPDALDNVYASNLVNCRIVGDVVVCGRDANGQACDLPNNYITRNRHEFDHEPSN